jgi:NhaA family Na+:H+ antiporter
MLGAAILAFTLANTPLHSHIGSFWQTEILLSIGNLSIQTTLIHLVNDLLMTTFFILIGLEIKFELTVGEFRDLRTAALPVLAAVGGCLFPIIIYLAFNWGTESVRGWGIPMATDIAFTLAVLTVLGSRIPPSLKIFLSTLAIADDIFAILVIAIFYGNSLDLIWIGIAALIFGVLILMNRRHVYALGAYLFVGILLWIAFYLANIHPTLAGILLALAIPSSSKVDPNAFLSWGNERLQEMSASFKPGEPLLAQTSYTRNTIRLHNIARSASPPMVTLMELISPVAVFIALPIFAFANAGVSLAQESLAGVVCSQVTLGVFLGLLIGKPLGIFLFSWLSVKLKIAKLASGIRWDHILGSGILGGIGFTMAIFIANLSFADPKYLTFAKLGILSASLGASIIGALFLVLWHRARARQKTKSTESL